MKLIPTSGVGLRDLASTARTSTATSTPYPSAPRRAPPTLRLPRLVPSLAEEPPARRKTKPTAAQIELDELEEESAKTTPLGSDEKDGSGNQSNSDPPLIPNCPKPVTTRSSGRVETTSRPKQKSSKRPTADRDKPSKRPKK